ncbi:MAG: hypothetical protein QNJ45_04020 [Ardenticatenaceae bacterium]|nr:hypothetical protein [Ardenticatenaceae bacterium]
MNTIHAAAGSDEVQLVKNEQLEVSGQAESYTVEFPYGKAVWNRPTAVVVAQNGQSFSYPIVDVTRIFQLAIWVIAAAAVLIIWRSGQKEK